MSNALIWGSGRVARSHYRFNMSLFTKRNIDIVGIVDSDSSKWGMRFAGDEDKYVDSPEILKKKEIDLVIVFANEDLFLKIKKYIVEQFGVNERIIKHYTFLLQQEMMEKYHDTDDKDIQSVLNYWKEGNILSVFNQYIPFEHTYDLLHHDESSIYPYVYFSTVDGEQRKMYFPEDYAAICKKDGAWYVRDLMREQSPRSPHLYVTDNHMIHEGDILLDVGTCEGNFCLRYINFVSKLYVFESDKRFVGPLMETFKGNSNVSIVQGFVGDKTFGADTSIDEVLAVDDFQADFIKMDIEGAELDALHGASKVIEASKPRMSICTYHKKNDYANIESFLSGKGYKTSCSNGYMVFLDTEEVYQYFDFRRGIIYAE